MIGQATIPKPAAAHRGRGFASWVLVVLAAFALPLQGGVHAQEAALSELDVKAAAINQFARFIQWPASAFTRESQPITVGVLGHEAFAEKLATMLKDKKASNRPFVVRKISVPQEAKDLHILFVGEEESRKMPQVLEVLKNSPVLTIGESPQFFENGGMINFYIEENQLRFEINNAAAERCKLNINSQVLRLAKPQKEARK